VERFCRTGLFGIGNSDTIFLVGCKSMTAKFCLPRSVKNIRICNYQYICFIDHTINDKFSIHQSGNSEPSEKFANGIK
jgi:hypothetical protein